MRHRLPGRNQGHGQAGGTGKKEEMLDPAPAL